MSRPFGIQIVNAREIHLPYLRGVALDISDSNLERSNLFGSYLKRIIAVRTKLAHSDIAECDFRCGNLRYSDFNGANCWRTEFAQADLRDIKNMELADKIGDAHYHKTKVNPREKKIIEIAMSKRSLFSVEGEAKNYQIAGSTNSQL